MNELTFSVEGRALTTASITAEPFSTKANGSNENLPIGQPRCRSCQLEFNATGLHFSNGFAVSSVTVPVFQVWH